MRQKREVRVATDAQRAHEYLLDLLVPPLAILPYAGTAEPPGGQFKLLNGQMLDPAEWPRLFTAFGTTFGGDGSTTFALPDLRGKTVLGATAENPLFTLQEGSAGEVTLAPENIPTLPVTVSISPSLSHSHSAAVQASEVRVATATDPDGILIRPAGSGFTASGGVHDHTASGTAGNAEPAPLEVSIPALYANWIIRA